MSETEAGRNWYAVCVRSRFEFKIEKNLSKKGIEIFLPAVKVRRRWTDRNKLVIFPLFPGYLFVNIDKNSAERKTVIGAHGVVRYVCMSPGVPEPIAEDQIMSLKKAAENDISLESYPAIKEGNRVRIKSGPLAGIEGMMVKKEKNSLLVLSVDILQKGAALKIDASEVERV